MNNFKRKQGKRKLEAILQKMIEADAVLLEWQTSYDLFLLMNALIKKIKQ